jgi:hypothetical protein
MTKELELKIVNRWPAWFDMKGDVRRTLMPFGFAHGDGWFNIIWNLCEDIERILPKPDKIQQVEDKLDNAPKQFEVIQVKQKFGSLRFYYNLKDAKFNLKINEFVNKAEELSSTTCEVCGEPGKLVGEHYVQTLCDKCFGGKQ